MCTVTVIAGDGRAGTGESAPLVRLVCNRDERRSRRLSTRPIITRAGARRVVMPIDPASGGTWLGVNDAGIVACLLNINPAPCDPAHAAGRRSRGEIVPTVLAFDTVEAAVESLAAFDARDYPPFRLIVLDAATAGEVASDGEDLDMSPALALPPRWFATSSGLGDHLVERHRRELFDELLRSAPDDLSAQRRLHDHRWPDHPALSVLMSRADARTVSRTSIDLTPHAALLTHVHLDDSLGLAGGEPIGTPHTVRLDIAPTAAGLLA